MDSKKPQNFMLISNLLKKNFFKIMQKKLSTNKWYKNGFLSAKVFGLEIFRVTFFNHIINKCKVLCFDKHIQLFEKTLFWAH